MSLNLNRKDFMPAPEGLHIARCYAVIDLGLQVNKKYGHYSPKVLIAWELSDTLMEDGRPYVQMQQYTVSLRKSSLLRALLEQWRGRAFSIEALQTFQLKEVLGKPCYLTTRQNPNPKGDQPWSDIVNICPLPSSITCPPPVNPSVYFDLDHYTDAHYLALSERIRHKINLSMTTVTGLTPIAMNQQPIEIPDGYGQDFPF